MEKNNRTFMVTKEDADPEWFVIDAEGKTLGRLASEIAKILRGKHKPMYTPHVNTGDGVIVINAEKVYLSGCKEAQKIYRHYTGHPSGMRERTCATMRARKPLYIIEHAVKGMVPKTKLGRAQMKKLRLFVGAEHDMKAQKPIVVKQ